MGTPCFDDVEVGGGAGGGVAAVAAYGERGADFDGAVGGVGEDAGDAGGVVLDRAKQAGGFPAHAEGEVWGSAAASPARKLRKSHCGMRAMYLATVGRWEKSAIWKCRPPMMAESR